MSAQLLQPSASAVCSAGVKCTHYHTFMEACVHIYIQPHEILRYIHSQAMSTRHLTKLRLEDCFWQLLRGKMLRIHDGSRIKRGALSKDGRNQQGTVGLPRPTRTHRLSSEVFGMVLSVFVNTEVPAPLPRLVPCSQRKRRVSEREQLLYWVAVWPKSNL